MKILACLVLFVLLGAVANGQQGVGGKVFAETTVMSEKIVKGSPFSADAVNESVQILADGNRIVRSSTNKLYRNSEGRFRREISPGSGGALSSFYTVGPGTTILDPVLGFRYLLDLDLKTARVGSLFHGSGFGVTTAVKAAPAQAAAEADRVRQELKAAELKAASPVAIITSKDKAYEEGAKVYSGMITTAQSGTFVYAPGAVAKSKYDVRKEDLGVQTIEGVEAVGTRTVTTIPAGDIGNERPIEMVYEKWYSNELQLVVMSRNSDPRFGEQTYRLTNIVRNEPDPSLFEVPAGFKVLSEMTVPRISPVPRIRPVPAQAENVVWTRASSPSATTVKSTKP